MHHISNAPEDGQGSRPTPRVLIVDDDPSIRTLMSDVLAEKGEHEALVAEDGLEALEILKQEKIDLVISDVRMPRMDGVSLLEKIRSLYEGLPVIMVTGFGGDFGSRALELGADDCIYLPFRVEEFKFRVSRTLRFHQLLARQHELMEANRELWTRAITDPLTRLYNRHYFQEVFTSEFRRAQRYQTHLGCIIFDIDLFKKINDEFGHLAGDQVLVTIGELIHQTIRKVDIAARYGGEEFVLILPATHRPGVELVAQRMRELVEKTHFTFRSSGESQPLPRITISLGAAHYPNDRNKSAEEMLKDADDRLLAAKRNGRNRLEVAW